MTHTPFNPTLKLALTPVQDLLATGPKFTLDFMTLVVEEIQFYVSTYFDFL
jgi:hypothetical protein